MDNDNYHQDHLPDPSSISDNLDTFLLEPLLYHLSNTTMMTDQPVVSFKTTIQRQEEADPAIVSYLCSIFRRASWKFIRQGMLDVPLLCLDCKIPVCDHLSTAYNSAVEDYQGLAVLWDEYQLATYAKEKVATDLEFGLFN